MNSSQPFTPNEHQRIHDAVAAIERSTAADLDLVVVRVSDRYAFFPLIGAAIGALVITGLVILMRPAIGAPVAFMFQILVLGILILAFDWLPIRLQLVPDRVKRARARQLAHREFAAQHARGGVPRHRILLFVSLGERYVEIIADHETYGSAAASVWEQMVSDFLAAVKAGRITDGVLAAIEACGAVLRTRHPIQPTNGR